MNVQSQKVTHRIAVLGAIQAADGGSSGVRMRGGVAAERGHHPVRKGFLQGCVRPGHTSGRHLTRAYLTQHAFKQFCVRRNLGKIQAFQHYSGGL